MTATSSIAKNFFSLTAAMVVTKILNVFVVVFLARTLQAEAYGRWSFAVALASYFSVLVNLGLGTVGSRELALNRGRLTELLSVIVPMKLIGALVGLVAVTIVALKLPKSFEQQLLVVLCYIPLAAVFWHMDWVFTGLGRLDLLGIAQVVESLVVAVCLFLFVRLPSDVVYLPVAATVGALVACALMVVSLRAIAPDAGFRPTLRGAGPLLHAAAPVAGAWLLGRLYGNLDLVLVSFMRTDAEVGWYSAAYRLLSPFFLLRYPMTYSLMPVMAQLLAESPERVSDLVNRLVRLAIFASVPLGLGGLLLAEPLVKLVYGAAFAPASAPLAWLAWSAALLLLNVLGMALLYAAGQQRRVLAVTAVALGVNLGLNLGLIPVLGIQGAALAMVSSDLVMLVMYVCWTRPFVRIKLGDYWGKMGAAVVGMAFVIRMVVDYNVIAAAVSGLAVYSALLVLLGGVNPSDWASIRQILPRKRRGAA